MLTTLIASMCCVSFGQHTPSEVTSGGYFILRKKPDQGNYLFWICRKDARGRPLKLLSIPAITPDFGSDDYITQNGPLIVAMINTTFVFHTHYFFRITSSGLRMVTPVPHSLATNLGGESRSCIHFGREILGIVSDDKVKVPWAYLYDFTPKRLLFGRVPLSVTDIRAVKGGFGLEYNFGRSKMRYYRSLGTLRNGIWRLKPMAKTTPRGGN
jgi:hypothetical protein